MQTNLFLPCPGMPNFLPKFLSRVPGHVSCAGLVLLLLLLLLLLRHEVGWRRAMWWLGHWRRLVRIMMRKLRAQLRAWVHMRWRPLGHGRHRRGRCALGGWALGTRAKLVAPGRGHAARLVQAGRRAAGGACALYRRGLNKRERSAS